MTPTSQDDLATMFTLLEGKLNHLDRTINHYLNFVRLGLGATIAIGLGLLGVGGFALSEIYTANKNLLVVGENTKSIYYIDQNIKLLNDEIVKVKSAYQAFSTRIERTEARFETIVSKQEGIIKRLDALFPPDGKGDTLAIFYELRSLIKEIKSEIRKGGEPNEQQ